MLLVALSSFTSSHVHTLSLAATTSATAGPSTGTAVVIPKQDTETEHEDAGRALALKRGGFAPDRKPGDDGTKCWIFTHMPKSGGSTIRDLMRDKWGTDKCIKYGNPEWKYGEEHAVRMLRGKWRIFAGSHAEALRRYVCRSLPTRVTFPCNVVDVLGVLTAGCVRTLERAWTCVRPLAGADVARLEKVVGVVWPRLQMRPMLLTTSALQQKSEGDIQQVGKKDVCFPD